MGPVATSGGGSFYAQVPLCDNDNNAHGSAPTWHLSNTCSSALPVSTDPSLTYYGGYGFCGRAAAINGLSDLSYVVTCKATPGSSAQGWVAALASIIVIGACEEEAPPPQLLPPCAAQLIFQPQPSHSPPLSFYLLSQSQALLACWASGLGATTRRG